MKAKAAMTRNVVCIGADDLLNDAYEIMTEWEVRHLPVLRGNILVGILSDRDVILHAEKNPDGGIRVPGIPVSDAMTENPITCGPSTDVAQLAATMIEHKIDSVPVVDDGSVLVGLVTSSDLLRLLIDKEPAAAPRPMPFQWRVYASVRPGMALCYA